MNKYVCSVCGDVKVTMSHAPSLSMKCCDGDEGVEHAKNPNAHAKRIPLESVTEPIEVSVDVHRPAAPVGVKKPEVSRTVFSSKPASKTVAQVTPKIAPQPPKQVAPQKQVVVPPPTVPVQPTPVAQVPVTPTTPTPVAPVASPSPAPVAGETVPVQAAVETPK